MKALVFTKPEEVVYRDEPDPIPGAGEVLCKVGAVGICGSDMHAWHGHDPRRVPPLILGHEVSGAIASGPHEGKKAVVNPLITCGTCDYCMGGHSNLCPERELIGMRLAGAFADYVSIPSKNLVLLPEDTDIVKASLTEPAAAALHSINLARVKSDRPLAEVKTLVIGGGAIGLLAALFLKAFGARDVVISETNALRRESAAEKTGFVVHDPASDDGLPADSFGLVIDAVGGAVTRSSAMKAVRPGGIVVHVGLMDSKDGLDVRKLTLQEITLFGVYTYTMADVKAAADAIYKGLLGGMDWIETRPLSKGADAFSDLDQGLCKAAKLVLIP